MIFWYVSVKLLKKRKLLTRIFRFHNVKCVFKVHAGYSTYSVHPLETVWIDASQGSRSNNENSSNENGARYEITLVMPEDTLTLSASTPEAKSEWLSNLQRAILHVLGKNI